MFPDQSKLNPELVQWFHNRQSRLKVVKTTSTPSGQILDWIPRESQAYNSKIATPPPPLDKSFLEVQHKQKACTFELHESNIERGPEGTVPVPRKNLNGVNMSTDLQKYLSKKGGLNLNKNRKKSINHDPANPTQDPNPFGYYHATCNESVDLYGCDGFLNLWQPKIYDSGDHSIMQTWLQNYDKTQLQSIEAGWTVDESLNGDSRPHIFTYYTTNAYTKDGDNLGGYNRDADGWQQYDANVYPGAVINGVSSVDGPQYEVSIKYQLYNGNWWFAVQGIWLGYYPGSLFNGALQNKAEWVSFGGEVYSSLSNPALSNDQMGSGYVAQMGAEFACYQRNLQYQSAADGTMTDFNGTDAAEDSTLYDIQSFMKSSTSFGSYFYAGGKYQPYPDPNMQLQIVAIRLGYSHEKRMPYISMVSAVDPLNKTWILSRADVYVLIQEGKNTFIVKGADGSTANVITESYYIKTNPDSTLADNLLSLPHF
jgi:hypothetical protein